MKKIFTLFAALSMVMAMMAVNMTGGEKLYLTPNSNWKVDNARFAIYVFGEGGDAWADMTAVAADVYEATIPSGNWKNLIFCRMNPATPENKWDNKWNQTNDLEYDGTNNHYTIADGAWDKGNGSWSVYGSSSSEPTPTETLVYTVSVPAGTYACYIAGEMNGWSFTAMTKVNDTQYTLELSNVTKAMKYKYCSGPDWTYVEKTANGEEKQDRTYSANDIVETWAAVYQPGDNPGNNPGDNPGDNPGNNPGDNPTPTPYTSSVPSACPDVMLQGFYWDSNEDKQFGNTRWNTLLSQASELAAYFDLIWLPPSAKSSGGVGYLPAQYSNQNSAWGTRAELETLIRTLHTGGAKVIADMVVNHASNKSTWCDYHVMDFGSYGSFAPDASWICKTDEVNSDSKSGSCQGSATGGNDDGYDGEANYAAARDWDHTNEDVREMFRAYAKWMIDVMKYDGFRYDYCKGFHNSHVNDYNTAAKAYFSVMEYWDGNKDVLWSRIQDANCNTLTFDFGVKYDALNRGVGKGNYGACKGTGLLGMGKGKYAVTFVDNHDTYQRDNGSEYEGDILQANAYILSMPGVPCVFYPHWKSHKDAIGAMVLARKAVGVHSESPVSDEADGGGYRAHVSGVNGSLILELGNKVSGNHDGYTKAAAGTGYAMWIKPSSSVAPQLIVSPGSTTYKTSSMQVEMKTVGGSGSATIYYTLDGSDPKTSSTKQTYSAPVTIQGTVTLKAYAEAGGAQTDVQTHTYTYKEPQTTAITVAFSKPAEWDKVYIYSWTKPDGQNAVEYTGGWPGTELTAVNENGFYYHQFDVTLREINFIFNAGEGKDQTADLWTDEDVCYAWQNGAEVKLEDCGKTPVENVVIDEIPALDIHQPMYNILGQRVGVTYQGVIIQNGYKYIR